MSKTEKSCSQISFPIKKPGPPKIWNVVEIKKDKTMKFSIQEIPEDRYEEVVEHMCKYFIADEPTCNFMNGKDDPEFVDTFRILWRDLLNEGLSVGAFIDDPNGGKPILAAANMLTITSKDEKFDTNILKSKKAKDIMEAVLDLSKKANVFEKYGVDYYMNAFGLSVEPKYRGASLGAHLLNARTNIGREYKIPVTCTAFTSPISQKLAERCGFETLVEQDYDKIVDKNGKPIFRGIKVKDLKVMAKRLD
ncbi:uncharacterized protein LOC108631325 [Ceratina calcarata]|uniref:Uncharacterized protein LOC108631325 n=1 Tax=Ceratina calcarata TaxID=156304 RepID=A0AAJ7JE87_9HYME|nr:uncharacterized protein LOC108631325 [Ceratina calcarata]